MSDPTRLLPRVDIDVYAQRIAEALFVTSEQEQADRLVLTVDGPPARALGGWSKRAVVDRVRMILSHLPSEPPL